MRRGARPTELDPSRGLFMTSNSVTNATIHARSHWNATSIVLQENSTYRFLATGVWWDLFTKCGADGYPTGNPVQEHFRNRRRMPHENWFALIGAFNRDLSTAFLLGSQKVYQIPKGTGGELCCFANDVCGFYWNNFGFVTLDVSELPRLSRDS
jgi:hypothetical protein